jgi:hypothetical protein
MIDLGKLWHVEVHGFFSLSLELLVCWPCLGRQGRKDIVFRFIIEYI